MKHNDEYNWVNYPAEYRNQIKEMMANDKQDFFIDEYFINENFQITFVGNIHPNWKQLYQSIFDLNPRSICEIGVGGGYHLHNLHVLLPQTELYGYELLPEQIEFAKTFSTLPDSVWDSIKIADFTKEIDDDVQFDLVFSQAVVMHQSTQHAIDMLRNMEKIALKNIVLIEGVKNHQDWFKMVEETLPEFSMEITKQYIDYGIILTRK